MILRKDQLEASLHEEKKLIESGALKEDSPLDLSDEFCILCEACRKGDLKTCQEAITDGANINARDQFDYTPLILVSGRCFRRWTQRFKLQAWRSQKMSRDKCLDQLVNKPCTRQHNNNSSQKTMSSEVLTLPTSPG